MKTPHQSGTRAARFLMGSVKLAMAILPLGVVLSPAFCQQTNSHFQENKKFTTNIKASREDILIVQLRQDVDEQEFDQLLQQVHGQFLRTIAVGPSLKFQVILAEPGQASTVEKRLSVNKDVAQVQRNAIYSINNDVISAQGLGSSKFGRFRPIRAPFKLGKNFGGKLRFGAATPPPPASFPVVNGPQLSGTSNDPYFTSQWDLNLMNFTAARNSGRPYGTPVPLYFCDTGYTVNADSPAMVIQYNFSDPINPSGGQEAIFDCGKHGTETATVTAYSDNHTGYAGMANLSGQRCMLYELRVSYDGQTAGLLNILSALAFIANNSGFPTGPVNISYNSPPPNSLNANSALQQAALQLAQRGFLVVLAAGNHGLPDYSPEMYMRRVGAVTMAGTRASFSNYGAFNTACPGVNVAAYTPAGGTSQTADSGTSLAAPRWCAAVAITMGAMSAATRSATTADLIVRQTAIVNSEGLLIPNLAAAIQVAAGM